MTPRKRHNGWTRNTRGGWTRTLGQRGARVRLFENCRNGTFYRSVWVDGREDVRSLGTSNRDEAEQLGNELVAALLTGDPPTRPERIMLQQLWDRFRMSETYRDLKPRTQQDYAKCMGILLGYFGPNCDVQTLTEEEIRAYRQARLRGGLSTAKGTRTARVRERTVQYDLVVLNLICRWATTVRAASGDRWLADNPLGGIRRWREINPRRPVATMERFEATRRAMQDLQREATTEQKRVWWLRLELALVLAEATGRRLSSIINLRWDDVLWTTGEIRWRGEYDKKGREQVVPVGSKLLAELARFQRRLQAVGGLLFPQVKDPSRPMDRHRFDKGLHEAERQAGLPKLEGGRWHPYRRKWATERKDFPLKDVAEAGGWKDIDTLLTCYQHPDRTSLLRVMSDAPKLTKGGLNGPKGRETRTEHERLGEQ